MSLEETNPGEKTLKEVSAEETKGDYTQTAETPHSGYHWCNQSERFFEGWYFRLTLPDPAQTFAFMYSIDDPAGGTAQSGGAAQILGPDETYYCRTFSDVSQFWAWLPRLGLGHWRSPSKPSSNNANPRNVAYLPPQVFESDVYEGYQATAQLHQGQLRLPSGNIQARWHYKVDVVSTWDTPVPRATAGWLSFFPIFEPGWQVLMAHGLATGWIEWRMPKPETASAQGSELDSELIRYTFENAPAYAEKNWGGAFPAKWFWMQCNAFESEPSLSVTAAAGIREVLMFKENVGLIGIHHKGKFYEFLSTKTQFSWTVDPWGYWHVSAQNHAHRVVLTGRATDKGAWVRVPTRDGLQFLCRDTTHGHLSLQLWRLCDQTLIVDASSDLAGLEIGGEPWKEQWASASN